MALTLALYLSATAATARGTPSLSWSAPAAFDPGSASAVSCMSESLCVAVDREGHAFTTFDPTASVPTWIGAAIDPAESLKAVSCAPGGACVAVDGRGYAFVKPEPNASEWSQASIDGAIGLTGVSCPTVSLCVAVDESGNALTSESPAAGGWTVASIDPGHRLRGVSCSSPSLCVAVDDAGNALSSLDPAGGAAAWQRHRIDFGELTGVSCSPVGWCVAIDGAGDVLAGADPTATAPTWSLTPVDAERLAGVSCASSGLCVAADAGGEALASDGAGGAVPAWSVARVDSQPVVGVSCLPGGFCMAVDAAGRSLAARVPPPAATTLTATEVSSATATLAGAVNPNDAVLDACWFEYGTSGAGGLYTQSAPCSLLPAAAGGVQGVSAQLVGLATNTTYHYRILASSPAGTSAGADATFTTAVDPQVALVHPHPSITGTPAAGRRLTCHAGTPAYPAARLSYAWLRDLVPIPRETASTYTVKYQDSGHHLQCQVTATDEGGSATARSAFVTIPVGGIPASVGETVVGRAIFSGGRLIVPIVCSPHAGGGCDIALRLTVVETLSGRRIVAVSALAKPSARRSATTLRHLTVTLASVRLHLATGAHRTVTAPLSATGRRLLAKARRFTASLSVSGTVIGAIYSQLAQQLVGLGGASHRASTHVAHRR